MILSGFMVAAIKMDHVGNAADVSIGYNLGVGRSNHTKLNSGQSTHGDNGFGPKSGAVVIDPDILDSPVSYAGDANAIPIPISMKLPERDL